uniref:LysR substrate-binding domain-containing protein n=1 Tax=Mesorhizobium sp. L-8-3 TaxID=2744522 RepID=UPI00313B6345
MPKSLWTKKSTRSFLRLSSRARIQRLDDLATQTLIHDLSVDSNSGFTSWETWLQAAGMVDGVKQRGLRVNNSAAVLQAAIDGHGVALARSILAHDDLAAGRLVRLFPEISVAAALAYFVVYRPERASLPRLVAFRDWLFEEAAQPRP